MKKVFNQGKGPQPDPKRDKLLISDYLAAIKNDTVISKVYIKHEMTSSRMYAILDRYGIKTRKRKVG